MSSVSDDVDLRTELAELTGALRAHLEWYEMTGSEGVQGEATAVWGEAPRWPASAPERAQRGESVGSQRSAAGGSATLASDSAGERRDPVRVAPPVSRTQLPTAAGIASLGGTATRRPESRPAAGLSSTGSASSAIGQQPLDGVALGAALQVVAAEVAACTLCPLHEQRIQTVFARGTGSSGLCFVGEGPGADEDAEGQPFVGKAGQLLDRMIAAMGLSRDEVYVCNIVKCRPPKNRKPTPEEMGACMPFLKRQIELLAPSVIVALGATAVEGLLGVSGGITRLRGNWKLYKGTIAVMPTFHPAYLLRSPGAKKDVWEDLQAVLRQMGRAIPPKR